MAADGPDAPILRSVANRLVLRISGPELRCRRKRHPIGSDSNCETKRACSLLARLTLMHGTPAWPFHRACSLRTSDEAFVPPESGAAQSGTVIRRSQRASWCNDLRKGASRISACNHQVRE